MSRSLATLKGEDFHWLPLLNSLPSNPKRLPAFFFAHGSPFLQWTGAPLPTQFGTTHGPSGGLSKFLKDFGKMINEKYKLSAIVIFSAHWETDDGIEVMYRDSENPLYYDYGFHKAMYDLKFSSRGSTKIADRVLELLQAANIPSKPNSKRGLDHGVFIPFMTMFPDGAPCPVVEASMHSSLKPEDEYALGQAMSPLRDENVLLLSGGLTLHTFAEIEGMMNPEQSPQDFVLFEERVLERMESQSQDASSLYQLTKDTVFRRAHPRAEHFIPMYIAAGAGEREGSQGLCRIHGALTSAFGLE